MSTTKLQVPCTYVKGQSGPVMLELGTDVPGNIANVVFQTWSDSGNAVEAPVTVTKAPWQYPADALSKVQDGKSVIQALIRDIHNKQLLKVQADANFITQVVPHVASTLPKVLSGPYPLAPGSYLIDPNTTVTGTASIFSTDPTNPAVLQLPSCWGATGSGPDVGQPKSMGTISVTGTLTLKDLKTVGAPGVDPQNIIFLSSHPGAKITAQNILMDGGGFYRGSGADTLNFTHIESTGKPRAYFVGLFDAQVNSLTWDNTGCRTIQQGGNMVGGSAQGETAIRLMWGQNVSITGLHVAGWKYDGTHYWKQVVQDRAGGNVGDSTSTHTWNNCIIDGLIEIDWMGGKRDPSEVRRSLGTSTWNNCTLQSEPVDHYNDPHHPTPPSAKIVYNNCTIAGKPVTKTIAGD